MGPSAVAAVRGEDPLSLYRRTRGLLAAHGVRPRKALGQHFVVDEGALASVMDAAEVGPDDTVLEIGGGVGALTQALARRASVVHCLEIDEALVAILKESLADFPNVTVHHIDALKFPFETLPAPYAVVANIPYQITAPLVGRFIAERERLSRVTLTVQREVARRLHASAGTKDYGALSVAVAYYFSTRHHASLPADAFWPPPKVDSAVISMSPRSSPPVEVGGDEEAFLAMVRKAFAHRRKTLRNNLQALRAEGWSSEAVEQAIAEVVVDGKRRAETLTLEEFAALWLALLARR
jgi:16S rRNA (adenine1518-N6/adenine1519-N6)-dimethyltransferase